MPISSLQLATLAESGQSLISLLRLQSDQVARLLRLRTSGEISESAFLEALSSIYAGQELATMPQAHLFEMTLLRFSLKRRENERARFRMKKLRAKGRGGLERETRAPSEERLRKEEEYSLMIKKAQEAEELVSDEDAIFSPFDGGTE